MAYFLKKTNRSKGLYLQIYFSFRDPDTKLPKNKCHQTLGFVSDLIAQGILDPLAHYQNVVDALNDDFRKEKADRREKQIGSVSPVKRLGYFPAASVLRRLEALPDVQRLASVRDFQFSISECLAALIYARLVKPVSKSRTAAEVLPTLWDEPQFSYDQILSCLDFIGNDYEKIVEIFTRHTDETYILDYSRSFFDCTNFYFEIDKEDEWRRKGPSKENRKDPIIGMGLLLDAGCIPVGMKLYPGNQSEKPVLREVIRSLKRQHAEIGRVVQVADKGLNCAQNIYTAWKDKDGYIFSKSVKQLKETERVWALKQDGFVSVPDPDDNSLRFRIKSTVDVFDYEFTDENGRKHKFKVREKRIVTYNPRLARKQKQEIDKMADKARGCVLSRAKKSEYGESAKYVDFNSVDEEGKPNGKKAAVSLNYAKIEQDKDCAGYNMLVTSETGVDDMIIYNTYHELWRIEESFRTMKSELDARPVYLQNINRIKGHFLICYLSVLLERLIQFKVLDNRFGSHQVYQFIRKFKVTKYSNKEYVNLTANSDLIQYLDQKYNLPVTNYYLTRAQIKKILERPL